MARGAATSTNGSRGGGGACASAAEGASPRETRCCWGPAPLRRDFDPPQSSPLRWPSKTSQSMRAERTAKRCFQRRLRSRATPSHLHRAGFRRYWTWCSRPKGGRPAIDPEVRKLIKRMATANMWGAPRIHGELLKLGIKISEATVSKYLPRRKKPPSQTWRTFLENHVDTLVSVDFFTVPTVLFHVLYVFVVLAHDRRRILSINVTSSPSAVWTANQIVQPFPWETAPRYLLRDRDGIYGAVFRIASSIWAPRKSSLPDGRLGKIHMRNA